MTIDEAIDKIAARPAAADIGKATNIRESEELCDVEIAGKAPALNARLGFAGSGKQGLLVLPKEGSDVIVLWVSGCLPVVVAVAEPERIVWRGGELGGLIKIEELVREFNALVQSVNSLVNAFNSHTHTVATTGTAAAQSGTAAPITSPAQSASEITREDIEDELIKH